MGYLHWKPYVHTVGPPLGWGRGGGGGGGGGRGGTLASHGGDVNGVTIKRRLRAGYVSDKTVAESEKRRDMRRLKRTESWIIPLPFSPPLQFGRPVHANQLQILSFFQSRLK